MAHSPAPGQRHAARVHLEAKLEIKKHLTVRQVAAAAIIGAGSGVLGAALAAGVLGGESAAGLVVGVLAVLAPAIGIVGRYGSSAYATIVVRRVQAGWDPLAGETDSDAAPRGMSLVADIVLALAAMVALLSAVAAVETGLGAGAVVGAVITAVAAVGGHAFLYSVASEERTRVSGEPASA